MSTKHVVLWDPSDEYWEGALVDPQVATLLRARHVATLPIEQDLIGRTAIAGYFKRSWGSGWPLGSKVPTLACPLVLYVQRDPNPAVPSPRRLNFAARLVAENPEVLSHAREGGGMSGMIRFAADSGQRGAHAGGVGGDQDSLIDVSKIGKPDELDGWTIYGGAKVNAPIDGFIGLALYSQAPGLRVAWAAVSQS